MTRVFALALGVLGGLLAFFAVSILAVYAEDDSGVVTRVVSTIDLGAIYATMAAAALGFVGALMVLWKPALSAALMFVAAGVVAIGAAGFIVSHWRGGDIFLGPWLAVPAGLFVVAGLLARRARASTEESV